MTPSFLGIPEERMSVLEATLVRTAMLAKNEPHFRTLILDTLENFTETEAEAFAMGAVYILMCQDTIKARMKTIVISPSAP